MSKFFTTLTTIIRHIILCALTIISVQNLFPQHPNYFNYNDENGLPSNEVYSIVQDKKGMIWIGCDAGLYKFDGVRYLSYKCKNQQSTSVTDLTFSSSGSLYCFNFKSQLFYLKNDSLVELKHTLFKISDIECDNSGNLLVNHQDGFAVYNEKSKKWKNYADFGTKNTLPWRNVTKSVYVNAKNEYGFLTTSGVALLSDNQVQIQPYELFETHESIGSFMLEQHNDEQWLISLNNKNIYKLRSGKFLEIHNKSLASYLQGKKITNIKTLSDGNFWICTYKGIVSYNPKENEAKLYYSNLSFSDCLIDREGNYWFSTLQSGIMRVPNLSYIVWNKENSPITNDKLTKITSDDQFIYFSTVDGTIGKFSIESNQLETFHTGNDADVQSLDYDRNDNCLYFNVGKKLLYLNGKTIKEKQSPNLVIKAVQKIGDVYIIASSYGTYLQSEMISESWSREIDYDFKNNIIWIASNDGLLQLIPHANTWKVNNELFKGQQILSNDLDLSNNLVYTLTYDGSVYAVSPDGDIEKTAQLPENVQSYKLKYYQNRIYLATNKGLWIFDLEKKAWEKFNVLTGLASNNVQDLVIVNESIWLATGKGLQKIPVTSTNKKTQARVYLKKIRIENKIILEPIELLSEYGQALILYPEASSYSSNSNFLFAYRVNKGDWIKLPSSIEQIEIQNLPSGNIEIELKAIDHLGRDSENSIILKGYVNPPFWLKWWFYLFLLTVGIIVSMLISFQIIRSIKQKEHAKTQLVNSQLKAIRAQMNPHFMYNTLNSIQDLILQNDIKNTNYYLSKFSLLMRQILAFSEEETVLLSEEVEMLQNYLELEKLRFGNEFNFILEIGENIDPDRTYIPSLILQPYIENAIKHGLLHKKGIKKLDIIFSLKGTFLEICIQDNGIGRKRSEEIKHRNGIFHKSFAENAIQKRLELLNINNNTQKIEVRISNVFEQENDTGTRVIIQLSMNPKQPFVNV